MAQARPPTTQTTHTLPFDKLSPRDFERLCLWLVEREGYERAEHLGAAGSDSGRDVVAWREDEQWAFQCKRVQRFGPNAALKEIGKVLDLPEDQRPAKFVFVVTCDVSAEARQRARKHCAEQMECHFWANTELDQKVKRHPAIVKEFFQAGDVIKSILVPGAPPLILVGDYEPLRDAYIKPWSVFERVNLDHFVGREWLLEKIDNFLENNDRGYFILEANAGLGKTAFLAWLTQERGYIHHFTELAPGSAGVKTGLRSLAAQLVLAYLNGDEARNVLPSAASRPDYLFSLLRRAAKKRHDGEKIVLVVDALDEAGELLEQKQNVLGLPQVLPKGVFFIVSKRPVPMKLPSPTPTTPHTVFQLTANSDGNQADVHSFLEQAAIRPHIKQAIQDSDYTQEQFINTLMDKCQGVWIYLHYVIPEIEQGEGLPLDLTTLPEGMPQYYARYWTPWQDKNNWYEIYLPVMATLAAAREPITVERLADWANVSVRAEELHGLLGQRWRHFIAVVHRDQQVHYQFYHTTLRDFCEGQVVRENLTQDQRAFVDQLKRATIEACRCIMQDARELETRRDAAFQLTRMRWLDVVPDVSPDEMSGYMELIGRYVSSPTDRRWFIQRITSTLVSEAVPLSDIQRIKLLVYRAINRGYLGKLDEASKDYEDARRLIGTEAGLSYIQRIKLLVYLAINQRYFGKLDEGSKDYDDAKRPIGKRLIATDAGLLEYLKVAARVNFGLGNIARFRVEMMNKSQGQDGRREGLETAAALYSEAAELAQSCGKEVILEANIRKELCWTYALLERWAQAEKHYGIALDVLEKGKERIQDPGTYATHHARVLETAFDVHLRKGQHLVSHALAEYETARRFAEEEIATLREYYGESESMDFAFAHICLGDCLWAMSEHPDCDNTQLLTEQAQEHWQAASDIARRLGKAKDMVSEKSIFYRRSLGPEYDTSTEHPG